MGLLQEAMEGRFDSFDSLAERILSDPRCRDAKLQTRSLGNMLRQIDRGERETWLKKRPEIRAVLAELLEVEPQRLLDDLADSASGQATASLRLPLTELREARSLDLLTEDLFPGIPPIVASPREWRRHWWHAASGSGRTIAGQWLKARGLALFLRARTWPEAQVSLPDSGAVYIELESPEGTRDLRPDALPRGLRVLIAAPFPSPHSEPEQAVNGLDEAPDAQASRNMAGARFTIVHAPPQEVWLPDLIRWVSERMRSGGGFNYEDALAVVQELGDARALFDTPGAVLGLCGLLEHLGKKKLQASGNRELVAAYLRHTLERSDRSATMTEHWLRDNAVDVLSGMVRSLVLRQPNLAEPLPRVAWVELVPSGAVPPVDTKAVREILKAPRVSEGERIKQALDRLTPSRDEVVRALIDLHLLEPRAEGRYVLRPIWVLNALVQEAVEKLPGEPPGTLGEALLRPHLAEHVLFALREAFRRGDFSACSSALSALDPECPVRTAAFEGCFRALGIAVLEGAAPDSSLLSSVWDAQQKLSFPRYDELPPGPRVAMPASHERGFFCNDGTFYLACLAINERLDSKTRKKAHPVLAPWHKKEAPVGLPRMLEYAGSSVHRGIGGTPAPWLLSTYALAGRLYERFGSLPSGLSAGEGCVPLAAPTAAVVAVRDGGPKAVLPEELRYAGDPVVGVEHEARRLGVPWAHIIEALFWDWTRNTAIAEPAMVRFLQQHPERREDVWRLAPPEALRRGLLTPWRHDIPYWVFNAEQWEAFLDIWRDKRTDWSHSGMDTRHRMPWQHMPKDVARRVLLEENLDPWFGDVRKVFWELHPETTMMCLLALLDREDRSGGIRLLWSTPTEQDRAVLTAVTRWVEHASLSSDDLLKLRRWLHDRVAGRSSALHDAYRLMLQLERRGLSEA